MTKMGHYFVQIARDQLATKDRLTKLEQNMVELTVNACSRTEVNTVLD